MVIDYQEIEEEKEKNTAPMIESTILSMGSAIPSLKPLKWKKR